MTEPRKIVLILGNGFDLDLGLKTSYKDFWESEYCPKKYPAPLIHHLNQFRPDNLEAVRWYDLENELLNYYKSIPDPTKGKDIITKEEKIFLEKFTSYGYANGWFNDQLDLVASLINKGVLSFKYPNVYDGLKEDALKSSIWRDKRALNLIKDGLCYYLRSIKIPLNKNRYSFQVLKAMIRSQNEGNFIDIFSFNYTHLEWSDYDFDDSIIKRVHGSCKDGKIIIGTRDDQTIAENYDFLQKAMDDSFNPSDIVTKLSVADEVVIFGHSLGVNDRQYFTPFFLKQSDYSNTDGKQITIFTRDINSKREIKRALQKMTNGHLSILHSKNQLNILMTEERENENQRLMNDFINKFY